MPARSSRSLTFVQDKVYDLRERVVKKKSGHKRKQSSSKAQPVHHESYEEDSINDTSSLSPKRRRTRSSSRPRTVHHVTDTHEDVEEPKRESPQKAAHHEDDPMKGDANTDEPKPTPKRSFSRSQSFDHQISKDGLRMDVDNRSSSRSQSVHPEIRDEEMKEDAAVTPEPVPSQDASKFSPVQKVSVENMPKTVTSNMTTPETVYSSARLKLVAIRHSPPPVHHSLLADTPYQYRINERMPLSLWSQQYYDPGHHSTNASRPNFPMFIRSDRLYEDDEVYEDGYESSNESILPSPSSSLNTTVDEQYSPEKNPPSFWKRMCSIM